MKIIFTLMLLIISVTSLSACNVSARDKDTSVSVSTNDGYYRNGNVDGYRHCPPGHAKKGWC